MLATKCSNEIMYNIPLVHGNSHGSLWSHLFQLPYGLNEIPKVHVLETRPPKWPRWEEMKSPGTSALEMAVIESTADLYPSTDYFSHHLHILLPWCLPSCQNTPKGSKGTLNREQRRPLCLGSSVSKTDLHEFICFINYLASGTVL